MKSFASLNQGEPAAADVACYDDPAPNSLPITGTPKLMDPTTVFRKYVTAYNDRDLDVMLGLFHENCLFENISGGKVTVSTKGRIDLRALARKSAQAFAVREQTITSLTAANARVAAEVHFHGILKEDLTPEMKAGTELNLRGVTVAEFLDGKIVRLSDYS